MTDYHLPPIGTSKPFISTPQDAPAYWLLDVLWVVHATGEQTHGSYSMVEQWMPQASGPPPHVHPYADESFWVMEGEMTVKVGGKTLVFKSPRPSSLEPSPRLRIRGGLGASLPRGRGYHPISF